MTRWICLSLGMLAGLAEPLAAQAPPGLYARATLATVEILVNRQLAGSGTLVHRDGLVLTAAHLFGRGRQQVEVLHGGRRHTARLLALDLGHDLALVELPPAPDGYPVAPLAEQPPAAGEQIFLLGAPLFRHRVMFPGMVARDDTTFEYVEGHYVEVVHVAAASPKGVSGGPWFNREGQVVGVQSSMMSLQSGLQGVAFVAPLDAVARLVAQRQSARTPTAEMAVEELWEQSAETLAAIPQDVHGVYVRICPPQGAAGKAGLKEGQVITEVEGQPVVTRDDFARRLRQKTPGESLKLRVWSRDGTRTAEVMLAPLEWELPAQSE